MEGLLSAREERDGGAPRGPGVRPTKSMQDPAYGKTMWHCPHGRGSVKCACRAARGSKRLCLNAQDIFARLLRLRLSWPSAMRSMLGKAGRGGLLRALH